MDRPPSSVDQRFWMLVKALMADARALPELIALLEGSLPSGQRRDRLVGIFREALPGQRGTSGSVPPTR